MSAVCGRAYPAALTIIEAAGKITRREGSSESSKTALVGMLYPSGSNPDDSPLHVLCCNDTCSFTWTGAEHINQVNLDYKRPKSGFKLFSKAHYTI